MTQRGSESDRRRRGGRIVDLRAVVEVDVPREVIDVLQRQLRDTDVVLSEGQEIQVVLAGTTPEDAVGVVVPRLRRWLPETTEIRVEGRAVA